MRICGFLFLAVLVLVKPLAVVAQVPSFPSVESDFNKALHLRGIQKSSSYCVMEENLNQLNGHQSQGKVKIASVSKIFTTYYVLNRLGKDYRYVTRFFYDPKTQHLHIHGSQDPFMGEKTMQFILAKLNQLGIYEAKKITFSEDFSFFRKVEYRSTEINGELEKNRVMYTHQAAADGNPTNFTKSDLINFFKNPMHYYQRTRNEAKKMGLNLPGVIKFKVPTNNILSLSRSVFSPQPGTLIVDYYSAPITKYLKELNKWSMNYVADELVSSLGGIGEMQNFFKERMGFTSNDIELYSGSGLELYVDANGELTTDDDLGRKQRVDNLASCDAVMTTLGSLNDYLVKNQMGLSDVMLIDGVDPGTFSGPDSIENAAIVKTGTLNTAVALVGQISSKTGPYYFGIFFEIKNKNLWGTARNQINTMLKSLIKSTGGKKDIGPHTKETFLPFDSSSIYSVTIQPIPGTTHDELH